MLELLSTFSGSLLAELATGGVSQGMKDAWAWIYIIGLGLFYLLVLAVIPLGLRDLLELFRQLGAAGQELSSRRAERNDSRPERNGAQDNH